MRVSFTITPLTVTVNGATSSRSLVHAIRNGSSMTTLFSSLCTSSFVPTV